LARSKNSPKNSQTEEENSRDTVVECVKPLSNKDRQGQDPWIVDLLTEVKESDERVL
jgi:hypothetical protein